MGSKRKPAPRRKPLARHKGLRAGEVKLKRSALKRTELKRTELKRARPDPLTSAMGMPPSSWRPGWTRWSEAVVGRGVCAVCGRGRRALLPELRVGVKLDPHHIVPQRYIRKRVKTIALGLSREDWEAMLLLVLCDPANGLCVCRDCHEAHERRSRVIPRSLLPVAAIEFAERHDFMRVIERLYPA